MSTLQDARDLLAIPGNLKSGYYAHNADGKAVDAKSPEATCWCALGAIRYVTQPGESIMAPIRARHLLTDIVHEKHNISVVEMVDARNATVPQVLEMFDLAIARAKENGYV